MALYWLFSSLNKSQSDVKVTASTWINFVPDLRYGMQSSRKILSEGGRVARELGVEGVFR